jgi:uncharacterized protein YbjT (DUF2867 family)
LIIGCGCRGRLLAAELIAAGHVVRGTTRDPARARAIEAVGTEAVVADPDRVASMMGALRQVSVVTILLGSAIGERTELEALHGSRLEMLLTKLVDTTVRGVVYEARGSVDQELLDAGAQQVRAFAEDTHAGCRILEADPLDPVAWLVEAAAAVEEMLAGETVRRPR